MIRSIVSTCFFFIMLIPVMQAQVPSGSKPSPKQQPAESVKSKPDYFDPDFFLVIDSVLGSWERTRKELEPHKAGLSVMDAAGHIYAIGTLNSGDFGEHVFRFVNNEWQVFEQNLPGDNTTLKYKTIDGNRFAYQDRISYGIENLLTDGTGQVYAVTSNKIFRAAADSWMQVAEGTFTKYNVFAGADGSVYYTEPVYQKKVYTGSKLYKVNTGKPELVTDNGKPLIVTGYLYADRKGNIYQYLGKQPGIKIWNGKEWSMTDDINLPVDNYWAFDDSNNLYITGHRVGENMFVKRLDGLHWKNIEIPDSISKKVYDWQLITDINGKIYLQADKKFEEAVLYRIDEDKFEFMGNQPEREMTAQKIRKFLVANDQFFALQDNNTLTDFGWKTVTEPVKYTAVWNVQVRKMAKIPRMEIVDQSHINGYKNLLKCFLFEDGGRYGIQTMGGRIIAAAVFDKIYIGYTPDKATALKDGEDINTNNSLFCYTLIQGKDTLYSKIGSYDFELPDPGTLETFKCKITSVCNYCNGTGNIKAHKDTITVKGEWVPGEVISTNTSTTYDKRYDVGLGRYVVYTTTKTSRVISDGHYKPDTKKVITVPESKCNRCNGRAVKRSYQVYKLSPSGSYYTITWK